METSTSVLASLHSMANAGLLPTKANPATKNTLPTLRRKRPKQLITDLALRTIISRKRLHGPSMQKAGEL